MKLKIKVLQFVAFIIICSCENNLPKNENYRRPNEAIIKADTIMYMEDTFQTINFKVVKRDTGVNNRVFVEINPKEIVDPKILAKVICQIIKFDSLEINGNISFFTKEEFANYKDEIFINDSIVNAEYDNWLNEYYYGEFEIKTRKFTKYPASPNLDGRMEHFLIPACK